MNKIEIDLRGVTMIAIGSDHAGYPLKEEIKKYLQENGIEYKDCGTYSLDSVDYPEYAVKTAKTVISGECEKAILVCGTGIGVSMAANRLKGIRAACCSDYFGAKYTRLHNDANVLCLGARIIGVGTACELVDVFLNTEFEGGRHTRRVEMLDDIPPED